VIETGARRVSEKPPPSDREAAHPARAIVAIIGWVVALIVVGYLVVLDASYLTATSCTTVEIVGVTSETQRTCAPLTLGSPKIVALGVFLVLLLLPAFKSLSIGTDGFKGETIPLPLTAVERKALKEAKVQRGEPTLEAAANKLLSSQVSDLLARTPEERQILLLSLKADESSSED
jgi:hypothetical protein